MKISKIFKKENLVLVLGILLLIGGSILFFIKDRYPVLVNDFHFKTSEVKTYGTWERQVVVDAESETILSNIKAVPLSRQISLAKAPEGDKDREATLAMVYEQKLPQKNPITFTDLLKGSSVISYALNVSNGQTFNKKRAQITGESYLVNFNKLKTEIKTLAAIYNDNIFVDFNTGYYLYVNTTSNYLCLSDDGQYLFWFAGQYLNIYRKM